MAYYLLGIISRLVSKLPRATAPELSYQAVESNPVTFYRT